MAAFVDADDPGGGVRRFGFSATTVSEGRGISTPFRIVAPWIREQIARAARRAPRRRVERSRYRPGGFNGSGRRCAARAPRRRRRFRRRHAAARRPAQRLATRPLPMGRELVWLGGRDTLRPVRRHIRAAQLDRRRRDMEAVVASFASDEQTWPRARRTIWRHATDFTSKLARASCARSSFSASTRLGPAPAERRGEALTAALRLLASGTLHLGRSAKFRFTAARAVDADGGRVDRRGGLAQRLAARAPCPGGPCAAARPPRCSAATPAPQARAPRSRCPGVPPEWDVFAHFLGADRHARCARGERGRASGGPSGRMAPGGRTIVCKFRDPIARPIGPLLGIVVVAVDGGDVRDVDRDLRRAGEGGELVRRLERRGGRARARAAWRASRFMIRPVSPSFIGFMCLLRMLTPSTVTLPFLRSTLMTCVRRAAQTSDLRAGRARARAARRPAARAAALRRAPSLPRPCPRR